MGNCRDLSIMNLALRCWFSQSYTVVWYYLQNWHYIISRILIIQLTQILAGFIGGQTVLEPWKFRTRSLHCSRDVGTQTCSHKYDHILPPESAVLKFAEDVGLNCSYLLLFLKLGCRNATVIGYRLNVFEKNGVSSQGGINFWTSDLERSNQGKPLPVWRVLTFSLMNYAVC